MGRVRARIKPLMALIAVLLVPLPSAYSLPAGEPRGVADELLGYINDLVSLGPRISGYQASADAAEYIREKLLSFGYQVEVEEFNVTVPVDYGTYVEVGGERIRAYALLPNLVETCYTDGTEGELVWIDAVHRDLRDFNGRDVKGKIVVMDFDSGDAWRWAAYLGAKGVIFVLDPGEELSYREELIKRFWIPVDFPRVAILKEDFQAIKKHVMEGERAKLTVRMVLEARRAYNVLGFLSSTGSDEYVMAAAYYDSWSIVPRLTVGADDALSAAILLRAARVMAERGVKRNLIVAFFAGHYQGLAGAREFIYAHKGDIVGRLGLVFEVKVTAYNGQMAIYSRGNFHNYYPLRYQNYILGLARDLFNVLIERNHRLEMAPPNDNPLLSPLDSPYYFNIEPFVLAEVRALVLNSLKYSQFRMTPADTVERLLGTPGALENMEEEAETYMDALSYLLNEYGGSLAPTARTGLIREIRGYVYEYNETRGEYTPVPNSTVVLFGTGAGTLLERTLFYRHYFVVGTDPHGYYEVHTIPHSDGARYFAAAFNDYPPEGPLKYGPDMGPRSLATVFRVSQEVQRVDFSVFRSGSLVFFDILDPDSASPIVEVQDIMMLDRETQNEARYGGFYLEWVGFILTPEMVSGTAMFFVNPTLAEAPHLDIVIDLGGTRWYSAIFNNDSRGYTLGPGRQAIIGFSVMEAYRGFRLIDEERLARARETGLFVEPVEVVMEESAREWEAALEEIGKGRYYEARGHALLAWILERKAYIGLRQLMFDASYSSVFFMLLVIPFAYLMERLVFDFEDLKKRFVAFLLIFLGSVAFMVFEHPGFTLMVSLPLIAVAFIMLILTLLPLVITSGHAVEAMKRLRIRFVGKHFAELDKLSAMVIAASLGIRNLRRRWLRTTLLILSVVIATMAFVSLISVLSARYVSPIGSAEVDYGYEGILIRQSGFRPLPPLLAEQIRTMFKEEVHSVSEIVFYYPASPLGQVLAYNVETNTPIAVGGILGMSPEDFDILPGMRDPLLFNKIFVPGSRKFVSVDERSVMVPGQIMGQLAEAGMRLNLGDRLPGLGLKIVGILNNTELYYLSVKDLDGMVVMPFAREQEAGGGRLVIQAGRPMEPSDVLIVPAKLAKDMGGMVYAIHVIPKDPGKTGELAYKLAEVFNYQVYYAEKRGEKYLVTQVAVVTAQQVSGGEALLPQVLLLFTILNSILGAVYERTREVGILSAVGLSPLHVAGIFLMEFTLIAVISSFIGYMAGITTPRFVAGLKVNAGTLWIVASILASMGVTLLATAYPVRYASRLVTPSFERRWRLESHAIRRGDVIEVRMPFVISREEIDGALLYLKEYLELFRGEEGPFSIDSIEYSESVKEGVITKSMGMKVRVKPFDWGVVMRSNARVELKGTTSTWALIFERLSGVEHIWLKGVRQLSDTIRKQLLMWRGLRPEDREEYIRRAEKELR